MTTADKRLNANCSAAWRQVIDINLTGTYLGSAPWCPRCGGRRRDVNISSEVGMIGHAGVGAYVASKWGVRGLTRRATATTVLCGEHFRRRQANAIGGTRAQDLLVVYNTTIQGYGHMVPNGAWLP